jgi:hypothetical protein
MKQGNFLYPSLAQIQQRLFGIDVELLQRVLREDPTLPKSFRLCVQNDPEHAKALQALKDAAIDVPEAETPATEVDPSKMPRWILDIIKRKVAASDLRLPRKPAAGLLLSVSQVITPPGTKLLDWQLNSPLYVLLNEPSPESDQVWLGWMVSPDADYAGWWDVVLEANDAPLDPACGMVQLWNPVKLYWPMASRLCGQVSATRLQVIRACAEEMLLSDSECLDAPRPGLIALRPVESMPGVSVLSGSPLGDSSDPRHNYQDLYFQIRSALLEPAKMACEQPQGARTSILAGYWNQCMEWGRQMGHLVLPQEPIGLALGTEDETQYCLLFDEALRITFHPSDAKTHLDLENVHLTESIRIEHSLAGELQDRIVLLPNEVNNLLFDPAETHELRWRLDSNSQWSQPLVLSGAV